MPSGSAPSSWFTVLRFSLLLPWPSVSQPLSCIPRVSEVSTVAVTSCSLALRRSAPPRPHGRNGFQCPCSVFHLAHTIPRFHPQCVRPSHIVTQYILLTRRTSISSRRRSRSSHLAQTSRRVSQRRGNSQVHYRTPADLCFRPRHWFRRCQLHLEQRSTGQGGCDHLPRVEPRLVFPCREAEHRSRTW